MPRAKRALWASAAKRLTRRQSAVRPVPYLRILGSYASYATPRHPQALAPSFPPRDEGLGASLQGKKRMVGASPAISYMHKEIGRARLLPLDLHHLVGFGAAWGDDLDLRALLLADESAGQ